MEKNRKAVRPPTMKILLIAVAVVILAIVLIRLRGSMAVRIEDSILSDIRSSKEVSLRGLVIGVPEAWETVEQNYHSYAVERQSGTGNGILCGEVVEYLGEENVSLDTIQTQEYAGQNVKITEDGALDASVGRGNYRVIQGSDESNINFTEYLAIVAADRSWFRMSYRVQSQYYTADAAEALLKQIRLDEYKTEVIQSIRAEYTGDLARGVKVDKDSEGLKVLAVMDDGTERDVTSEAVLAEPVVLEADRTSQLAFDYSQYGQNYHCELPLECSTKMTSLEAVYSGSTERGTQIGFSQENVTVNAIFSDGSKLDVTEECYMEDPDPVTLEAGETVKMQFTCDRNGKSYVADLQVACTTEVTSLEAVYEGPRSAGTRIQTGAEGLSVTAHYSDGSSEDVTGYAEVENPSALEAGTESVYEIRYKSQSCELAVSCEETASESSSGEESAAAEEPGTESEE